MDAKPDIVKIGALIFDEQARLLVSKSKKQDTFVFVGGKIKEGESHEQCLNREIREELGEKVVIENIKFYQTSPIEPAESDPSITVQIYEYIVEIKGKPEASREITELKWISKAYFEKNYEEFGKILREQTIPDLIKDKLIK